MERQILQRILQTRGLGPTAPHSVPARFLIQDCAFSEGFRFGASYLEFGCLLHSVGRRIRILTTTGVIHHMNQVGRSYEIPIEQRAASYFAVMMLAQVYQPGVKHLVLLAVYFLKEMVRQPLTFVKAIPWALRERHKRTGWYRQWILTHGRNPAQRLGPQPV